jgi:membrane-bound metal-dependent hydrolase YbcI (DUF457 family)
VDPVSHLLFARMVSALRPARSLPRGVVAATVLGGLAPDVDAALMAIGWDVYLRWHELGTHALVGSPVVALATAGLVRTWAPQAPFGALTFGAWLGVLSHVFFDIYSGAGIQVLWPFSSRVVTAPVVAMADPIAIAVLALGAVAFWVWPRVPRTAAALVMALLALVSGVKLATRARAATAYEAAAAAAGPAPSQVAMEAVWGSWREWRFFDRLPDGTVRAWQADGVSRQARLRFTQSPTQDQPFARASLDDFATARTFVPVHPFAFASLRHDAAGHVVFWSDARFCWTPDEQADAQDDVPHQDVRPAKAPLRCALWFGGSYDTEGRPYEALVWLGGHLQRRAPQRWRVE